MTKKIRKNNIIAFWLAMISSLFLFISGTTGVASWTEIENIVLKYINLQIINVLFILVFIIAALGGFAVFIGGLLILKEKVFLGNLLISFGSGAGIISFFLNVFISIATINLSIYSYLSFSSFAIIFALSAQIISGNNNKKKKIFWYNKLFNREKNKEH